MISREDNIWLHESIRLGQIEISEARKKAGWKCCLCNQDFEAGQDVKAIYRGKLKPLYCHLICYERKKKNDST